MYTYGMFETRSDGQLHYVWHPASSMQVADCYMPTGRRLTPGELRVRMEVVYGSSWVEEHWGEVVDLLAVAYLHTSGDLAYEQGLAKGIFAVDSRVWDLQPCPIAPGDPRLDLRFYQDLLGIKGGDHTALQGEWWPVLMAQLRVPTLSPAYDWPDPRSTVLEDNGRNGMGILAPLTVEYVPFASPEEQVQRTGHLIIFTDPETGVPIDEAGSSVQDALWSTALRCSVIAAAWWWPAVVRRAILMAARAHPTQSKVTLAQFQSSLAAQGDAACLSWWTSAYARLVLELRRDAYAFLPPRYLSGLFEERAIRATAMGRQEERAGQTADEVFNGLAGALTDAKQGAGSTWWILVGAAALAIVLFGAGKGGAFKGGSS